LKALLRERVSAQLAALQPKDAASLKKYRDLLEPAWKVVMSPRPSPAAAPGGGRRTLVVATKAEDAEPYKDAATVLLLGAPHAPEPTAGGDANQRKGFPATFYRTELARQVQDVLDELSKLSAPGAEVRLVALGEAALPALLARAVGSARVSRTILDASALDAAVEASTHPGLHRLGGWLGAAKLAPAGYLVLHGRKTDADSIQASYQAAGRGGALTVSEQPWSRERILEELAK
jgi:hypothetical protein